MLVDLILFRTDTKDTLVFSEVNVAKEGSTI